MFGGTHFPGNTYHCNTGHIILFVQAANNMYNVWFTSTILWSSQLHACCVRDTLQTLWDAFNLIDSLSVVETLLLFVKLGSSCRKPNNLATFLYHNHATMILRIHTNTKPFQKCQFIGLLLDDLNITKGRSFSTTL